MVDSGVDTCLMALHSLWVIEDGLAVTACSEARVFPRDAHVLLRRLQDMWTDNVIMTGKSCGYALQFTTVLITAHRRSAIVLHRAAHGYGGQSL
jgi:hypothetical protein